MIEKRYNFCLRDSDMRDEDWVVWWDEPNDKHAWAFIHYCRRSHCKVYVKGDQDSLNIAIKRPKE